MRSSIRRTTVVLLLTAFLIPGLLQARTPGQSWDRVSVSSPESFFSMVWNLLTSLWLSSGSGDLAKNGPSLDPNGGTPPPPSGSGTTGTTTTDNGPSLDPNG
jgi:hypothetical protein